MTLHVPATGETFDAALLEDTAGTLRIVFGRRGEFNFGLGAMLATGWQIVDATNAEPAQLEGHGSVGMRVQ